MRVLGGPGMDARSSCVGLSRPRDGMELHYGRDDFANPDRLTQTLSRDRAKDMASAYAQRDPAQGYAEQRGIIFGERVAEMLRRILPARASNRVGGLRETARAVRGR